MKEGCISEEGDGIMFVFSFSPLVRVYRAIKGYWISSWWFGLEECLRISACSLKPWQGGNEVCLTMLLSLSSPCALPPPLWHYSRKRLAIPSVTSSSEKGRIFSYAHYDVNEPGSSQRCWSPSICLWGSSAAVVTSGMKTLSQVGKTHAIQGQLLKHDTSFNYMFKAFCFSELIFGSRS